MKTLLVVAHCPSENTAALRDALLEGAAEVAADGGIQMICKTPFETGPRDVLSADGIVLGTTENLGYMSGALKDFFDRIYYPCLEETQGRPYALWIRAGHDGTGTRRAVESITTGLRWRAVTEPVLCRGAYDPAFAPRCRELGQLMAAGLEAGVF